jgi:putative transposase
MTCPHCGSTATTGRSDCTELGYHRFRCHDCRRVFNERTGTPFNPDFRFKITQPDL